MRVGRIKVIFVLPPKIYKNSRDSPREWPQSPLAYVEWYTKLAPAPNSSHGMYALSHAKQADGSILGSVIPLHHIRQSCQLQPNWGRIPVPVPSDISTYTSDNILDTVDHFLLNNWTSLHAYQTLW